MTVTTIDNTTQYIGDGIEVAFSFSFQALSPDHMFALLNSVNETGINTVLNPDQENNAGGIVTFDDPPEDGVTITLVRIVPQDQQTDYQEYDPFPAKTHEAALDKLTMLVQQNAEEINRAIQTLPGTSQKFILVPGAPGESLIFDETDPAKIVGSDLSLNDAITAAARAEAAADSAEDTFNEFKCTYHSASYTPPAGCVNDGDLWYDLGQDLSNAPLKYFSEGIWISISSVFSGDYRQYTDAAGQTEFAINYPTSAPVVTASLKGLALVPGVDFTFTDDGAGQTTITLTTPIVDAGDYLILLAFEPFKVASHPTWEQAYATFADKTTTVAQSFQGRLRWSGPTSIEDPELTVRIQDIESLVGAFYTKGEADSLFVRLDGSHMTGQISMGEDPSLPLHLLRLTDLEFIGDLLRPIFEARYVIKSELVGDVMVGPLTLNAPLPPSDLNHAIRVQDLQFVLTNDPNAGNGNLNKAPVCNASGLLDAAWLDINFIADLALFNPVTAVPPLQDNTDTGFNYLIQWSDADDVSQTFDYDFGGRIETLVRGNLLIYVNSSGGGTFEGWLQVNTDLGATIFLPLDGSEQMIGKLALVSDGIWANYATDHAVTKQAIEDRMGDLLTDIIAAATAAFVEVNGDSMTGLLLLSGDPLVNLGAVTKQYADSKLNQSQADLLYVPRNANYAFGNFAITCRNNAGVDAELMNFVSVNSLVASFGFITQAAADGRYLSLLGGIITGNLLLVNSGSVNLNVRSSGAGAIGYMINSTVGAVQFNAVNELGASLGIFATLNPSAVLTYEIAPRLSVAQPADVASLTRRDFVTSQDAIVRAVADGAVAQINAHENSRSNPHNVTAAQVGAPGGSWTWNGTTLAITIP